MPVHPGSEEAPMDSFANPAVFQSATSDLASRLAAHDAHENNGRFVRGVAMLLGAGAVTAAVTIGANSDGKWTRDLPFSETAQEIVESVDTALSYVGTGLLPLGVATIAGVKIGSKYSPRLRAMDKVSSKELTDDGKSQVGSVRGGVRKVLRNYVAGSIPLVASTAALIGADMAAVGEEIGTGPDRPIHAMFNAMHGEGPYAVIAQDSAVNPMLQSNITRPLVSQVMRAAEARGVATASPVDLFLPSISYEGHQLTSLVIAFPHQPGSELAPEGDKVNCQDVPVKVDETAGIPKRAHIKINGTPATVVGKTSGTAAINRVGIEMDREAFAACLQKNPEAPDSMVILETNQATARDILQEANANLHETATVLTEQQYLKNSEKFWKANSKPVTNVLALMATVLSYVSMDSITNARMLRNRREWATKLAQGVGDTQMRLTELLRATKDGVAASVVGVGLASVTAPAINFLESGLRVGLDFRSAMVGCAVATLGSIGGTLHRVLRPRKTINVSEDTRI